MGATTGVSDVRIPAEIESASAKLVYFYVAATGAATADDLCAALDLEKGTILTIARTLCERGHLTRRDGTYRLA